MTGMLEPVFKEVYKGRAAGARSVPHHQGRRGGRLHGAATACITRDSEVRLLRDNVVVHTGKIESLQALQERRERSEGRLRVRHHARELQRHQAGRRDRSVRHGARGARSSRRNELMPSIGVLTFELRLDDAHSLKDKRHFVKSLKDRLRAQVQRGGGRDRLSGPVAARR